MDQEQFDTITRAVAEQDARPVLRRRLFSGGIAVVLAALGLGAASVEDAAAGACHERCQDKNTGSKRRRCLRRCRRSQQRVGCRPGNNTQGSCPEGKICNNRNICVPGCTGGPGRGTCPSGQQCIDGQCV
jgi:hypothetical protein